MVLTAGHWGRQYQDSYWISSSFFSTLLILAYMTDSNWKHRTPEVAAKSTVRLKKDHLLIKLNCTHWRQRAIERMKRRGAREKNKNKKKDKSLHSLCDLGRQKNKLHFSVMAPKGQNRHRFPLSAVGVRACWYMFHQFPQESQKGAQAFHVLAFHLGFFCIPLHSCLLSLPSSGQNWLLLFQTALSLLMPQVSGLCTPWEPGLERAATNLPR